VIAVLFEPALRDMEMRGSETFGPESFKDYRIKHGLTNNGNTPTYISVDELHSLQSDLRHAKTMVFRLGAASGGTGTAFALSRLRNDWSDFFIDDHQVFAGIERRRFSSTAPAFQLLPFQL
jgi:hypothetical protein